MAVTCGFFNGADRAANATDICSIFDGLISDGIYDTIGTAFAVTAAGGNFLNLGIGRAWFNHTWTKNDSVVVYEAPAAELLINRWDRMVLEVDHSDAVRTNRIFIMKGTPSSTPSLPSLSAGPLKFQYSLAKIYRAAGSTSIAQIDITPEQGTVATPFVNALVEKFDIAAILIQYSDRANELIDDLEAAYLVVQQTGIPIHHETHAIGSSDPLSPASIGALPYDAASSNLLINGGFDVWQRGTSLAAGTGGYLADRWANNAVTSTIATSQQSFTPGQTIVPDDPKFYLRSVVVAGNTDTSLARTHHRIENVRILAGRTVTISFWVKADASKYIAIEFLQNFGSGGSPSAFVSAIGAEKIEVTTSWQKITRTIILPSISGKTFGTTPNTSYTQFAIWYDCGSYNVARASNIGYQSGTFDLANVQLNYGSVSLPFVPIEKSILDIQTERLYEKSFEPDTAPAQNTGFFYVSGLLACKQTVAAGGMQYAWQSFKTTKRAVPTMTFYNPAYANAQVRNLTRSSNCTDLVAYATTKGFIIAFTCPAGSAVGDDLGVHWSADIEL